MGSIEDQGTNDSKVKNVESLESKSTESWYFGRFIAIEDAFNLYMKLTCLIEANWDDVLKIASFLMEDV